MEQAKKYWFRAKRYGWGWGSPSSWQGWGVLVLYIALNVGIFYFIDSKTDAGGYGIYFILSTLIFITICYFKGEKLGWRWGDFPHSGNERE